MKRGLLAGLVIACGLSAQVAEVATIEVTTIEVATIPAEAGFVVLAKTGRLAAAVCRDKTLHVWSLPDGKAVRSIDVGDRAMDVVTISDDGRWIAAGDHRGGYTVWDTASGAVQMELKMAFYPFAIAFSTDGKRIAIAPAGEPVQIYDLASRKKLFELQRPVGGTAAVAFSRDGARIATADADTEVRVYDARTGELISSNADFLMVPLAAAFTADGKHVLTAGGDKIIALVDAATGNVKRRSAKLVDPPIYMETSPDGALLAAGLMHADNMLQPAPLMISEVASGRTVQEWKPATMMVGGTWTTDGHLLVATTTKGAIHLWRVR
ncbi:MAG: hypothetical protein JWP63_5092 [Candidatus Solibacter sp.]|nr:hypothetical protein [Candidatus Solibacter sp.]